MNDKTAQSMADALIDQIESAARASFRRHQGRIKGQLLTAADCYDSHLLHAAYQAGIHAMHAQLAEAQKDAERWGWVAQCARLDQFGGFVVTPDEPAFASDVSLAFIREIDAAIGAAKGESNG